MYRLEGSCIIFEFSSTIFLNFSGLPIGGAIALYILVPLSFICLLRFLLNWLFSEERAKRVAARKQQKIEVND